MTRQGFLLGSPDRLHLNSISLDTIFCREGTEYRRYSSAAYCRLIMNEQLIKLYEPITGSAAQ